MRSLGKVQDGLLPILDASLAWKHWSLVNVPLSALSQLRIRVVATLARAWANRKTAINSPRSGDRGYPKSKR
jgi:hypothetical protein